MKLDNIYILSHISCDQAGSSVIPRDRVIRHAQLVILRDHNLSLHLHHA